MSNAGQQPANKRSHCNTKNIKEGEEKGGEEEEEDEDDNPWPEVKEDIVLKSKGKKGGWAEGHMDKSRRSQHAGIF